MKQLSSQCWWLKRPWILFTSCNTSLCIKPSGNQWICSPLLKSAAFLKVMLPGLVKSCTMDSTISAKYAHESEGNTWKSTICVGCRKLSAVNRNFHHHVYRLPPATSGPFPVILITWWLVDPVPLLKHNLVIYNIYIYISLDDGKPCKFSAKFQNCEVKQNHNNCVWLKHGNNHIFILLLRIQIWFMVKHVQHQTMFLVASVNFHFCCWFKPVKTCYNYCSHESGKITHVH